MHETIGDNIVFNEYGDPKNTVRRNQRIEVDKENKITNNYRLVNKSYDIKTDRNRLGYLTEKFVKI